MNGFLELKDTEFFDNPSRASEEQLGALVAQKKHGLFADAPRCVSLNVRHELPIILLYAGYSKAVTQRPIRDACLVANGLHGGEIRAAQAVRPSSGSTAPSPPPPNLEDISETGQIAEWCLLEARERLQLPWLREEYVLRVLLWDEVSARVQVKLQGPDENFADPAVEVFRKKELLEQPLPALWPRPRSAEEETTRALPHFDKRTGSPELPDAEGLVITTERIVDLRKTARFIVHGSFRLKPLPQDVVSVHGSALDKERQRTLRESLPDDAALPTALLRIGLVLTGTEDSVPTCWQLICPSYGDPSSGAVSGHFSLDLCASCDVPLFAQTHFLYAFHGEHMAGPAIANLIDR